MKTIRFPNEKPVIHGSCLCGCDKFYLILDSVGGRVESIQCCKCGEVAAVMDEELDEDDGFEIDVDID